MNELVIKTDNTMETGGILMGYTTIKDEVVITHCCGPGPKAKQKKSSIVFDRKHAQRFVEEVYRETEGRITYLGDWHSHTAASLSPSRTDEKELKKLSKTKRSRTEYPLMLIAYSNNGVYCQKVFSLENAEIYEIDNIFLID